MADPMLTAEPLTKLCSQSVKRYATPFHGLCASTGGAIHRCVPVTSSHAADPDSMEAHFPHDRTSGGFTLREKQSD